MNHIIVTIIGTFGSLFFSGIIYPQLSIGIEGISNQSYLQNPITKKHEQKNNFENPSKDSDKMLGIVENDTFFSLESKSPRIITSVMMQEAKNPEEGIIDLHPYEGQVLLITYQQADEDILWGADIVDAAGPILTIMVKKSFGLE